MFSPADRGRVRARPRARRSHRWCCTSPARRARWPRIPSRSITGWAQWWPVRMAMPCRSTTVPMSCGWMPLITKERTLAFRAAVPIRRSPGTSCRRAVPYSSRAASWDRMASKPTAPHVVDCGAQPDRAGDVRRARFELVGQLVPGAALERDGADHVSAAEERRHLLQHRLAPVEHADPGRAVQLVAGEHVEVGANRRDVRRHVVHGLRSVHERQRAGAMRQTNQLLDGIDRAQGVREVRHGRHARLRREQPLELVHEQLASIVHRRDAEHGALPLAEQLPGHDVRVVLHRGDEDFVSRADVRVPPRARDEVDALGRVPRVDDLARRIAR